MYWKSDWRFEDGVLFTRVEVARIGARSPEQTAKLLSFTLRRATETSISDFGCTTTSIDHQRFYSTTPTKRCPRKDGASEPADPT